MSATGGLIGRDEVLAGAQVLRAVPVPQAWVLGTALNTGASWWWWWRRRRELPLADHDLTAPADLDSGLDATLLTAIWRLPSRRREGDTASIARQLGIEAGTVRMHLSRGVAELRH